MTLDYRAAADLNASSRSSLLVARGVLVSPLPDSRPKVHSSTATRASFGSFAAGRIGSRLCRERRRMIMDGDACAPLGQRTKRGKIVVAAAGELQQPRPIA